MSYNNESAESARTIRRDHESISYACDPNYQNPESKFGIF